MLEWWGSLQNSLLFSPYFFSFLFVAFSYIQTVYKVDTYKHRFSQVISNPPNPPIAS